MSGVVAGGGAVGEVFVDGAYGVAVDGLEAGGVGGGVLLGDVPGGAVLFLVATVQAHGGDLAGAQDVILGLPGPEVVVEAQVDECAGTVGAFAAGACVAVGGLGEPAALVRGEEFAAGQTGGEVAAALELERLRGAGRHEGGAAVGGGGLGPAVEGADGSAGGVAGAGCGRVADGPVLQGHGGGLQVQVGVWVAAGAAAVGEPVQDGGPVVLQCLVAEVSVCHGVGAGQPLFDQGGDAMVHSVKLSVRDPLLHQDQQGRDDEQGH
ncbi:hypothetical protein V6P99_34355 [Streptomyces virginiae]|uniref:hypothetical protein n=1 Tax=Streptomyces virginiae TaxID=1961 RepID=UPI0030CD6C20